MSLSLSARASMDKCTELDRDSQPLGRKQELRGVPLQLRTPWKKQLRRQPGCLCTYHLPFPCGPRHLADVAGAACGSGELATETEDLLRNPAFSLLLARIGLGVHGLTHEFSDAPGSSNSAPDLHALRQELDIALVRPCFAGEASSRFVKELPLLSPNIPMIAVIFGSY